MPKFQITGPDGGTYEVTAPDGATEAQVLEYAKQNYKPAEKPAGVVQQAKNAVGGLVRGAGSIGATILDSLRGLGGATLDATPEGMRPQVTAGLKDLPRGPEMRAGMDAGLKELGADPNSLAFQGGKLGAEVAGTAGAGGAIAKTAAAAGAGPALVNAIRTGGMAAGSNATRAAGGAVSGGAMAGLVDPESAHYGLVLGGLLPAGSTLAVRAGEKVAGGARTAARNLMQAAIKPTLAQRTSGEADTAINTLLDYGISPTKGGVNKLRELIDDLNSQVVQAIDSSGATVSKQNVLARLGDVRSRFSNQVSPTGDLNAIQAVADDFVAHPALPGDLIPVKQAQAVKQGTYRILAGKYGEVGSASTEAQKGVARGLREEIANAVPGVQALNAEESRLLTTLSVAERRALLEANKNPGGLAWLSTNPASWAAFMADRSSAFKALAARMVNKTAPAAGVPGQAMIGAASNPLLRAAATSSGGIQAAPQ